MSTLKYWVWLSALHLRPKAKQLLLSKFHDDPMALYYAPEEEWKTVEGIKEQDLERVGTRELETAMEILERCERDGISITTWQDAAYPRRLKNIYDPPVVLYGKGRMPAIDEEPAIAVVGTRGATPYGEKMARRMGYELTKCGGLVISGLTRGIDRLGAEGALRAGGRVVGVLGTGLDQAVGSIYEDVAAVGALVTEYPPGLPSHKINFRMRNRITAGLSEGVVVIEAPERSGALLFADEAAELGKEIFAVPGNADAENSVGTNQLIRDGAKAVTSGWDVMSDWAGLYPEKVREYTGKAPQFSAEKREDLPKSCENFVKVREPAGKKVIDKQKAMEYIGVEKQLSALSESQLKIVAVMGSEPMQIDDIIAAAQMESQTVLSELTMLQIDGVVRQEPGKRFTLNIIRG